MADAGAQKAKADNVDAKDEKQDAAASTGKLVDQQVVEELDTDAVKHENEIRETELAEKQDLNQGMDTGTHDSGSGEINWGEDFRVREQGTHKILRGNTPDETPKK